MKTVTRPRRRRQGGIALLEALLAILMLAIGLLGTIGLQARAYSALSDAGQRAEATIAVEKLLGVMSNDLSNLDRYALAAGGTPSTRLQTWYDETLGFMPGAGVEIGVTPSSDLSRTEVKVTIRWIRKAGDAANNHTVIAYMARS